MEGLKYLCMCCKKNSCSENRIEESNENNCKIFKCLDFEKDNSKIEIPEKFDYIIRSDNCNE